MGKVIAFALLLVAFACADKKHEAAAVDHAGRPVAKTAGQDEAVTLDQVPEAARKAAEAAVPGATFTSAEKEIENGTTVYSLEGTVGGKACEVEVTPDGKVTEIENGADDEDGDEDDGDEDDDD